MSIPSSKKITLIFGAELDKLITLPLTWLALMGTFVINLLLVAAFTSVDLQGTAGTQSILDIGLLLWIIFRQGSLFLGS